MPQSFSVKMLEARITLAEGGFDPGTGQSVNTKIFRLGMDAEISKPGGKEKNKCTLKIYNMRLSDMETLTTLAFDPLAVQKNRLTLLAGDGTTMSQVFQGDITSAVPSFSGDASSIFEIQAITGYVATVTPKETLTGAGSQDVAQMLQRLAQQMGLTFKNRGVEGVKLRNVAFVGGAHEQAKEIAEAARIQMILDDDEMIIGPQGKLRSDDAEGSTPVLRGESEDRRATGLIGFPSFDAKGIACRCYYEPRLQIGGPVRIESIVPKASGLWRVTSLSHSLQANHGQAAKWETSFKATYPNQEDKDGTKVKKAKEG